MVAEQIERLRIIVSSLTPFPVECFTECHLGLGEEDREELHCSYMKATLLMDFVKDHAL